MDDMFFLVAGIVAVLAGIIRCINKARYIAVDAICQDMVSRNVSRGGFFLRRGMGTFQYEYAGQRYLYRDHGFNSNPKKVRQGSRCVIFLNPKNPEDCLPPSYNTLTVLWFLVGLLILIYGLVL